MLATLQRVAIPYGCDLLTLKCSLRSTARCREFITTPRRKTGRITHVELRARGHLHLKCDVRMKCGLFM